MKIKFVQLLNAATMIFPFFAWRKHRDLSSNIIHKIMKIHIPISALFHLSASFMNKNSRILYLFQHTDILLIHISTIFGTISVIKNFFPRRKSLIKLTWISGILHIHSFIINIIYDNGDYRSILLIVNTLPIIIYKRYKLRKIFIHTLIACKLYHFNDILVIGHSCFHIMLYNIYDDYFIILKRKRSLNLINLYDKQQ